MREDIDALNSNISLLKADYRTVYDVFVRETSGMKNISINSKIIDEELSSEIIEKYKRKADSFFGVMYPKGIEKEVLIVIRLINALLLACAFYFFSCFIYHSFKGHIVAVFEICKERYAKFGS
ncbi:MAG TPA: hypothetical protein DCL21_03840 [Alphaproteobacteria bacterium]|nr:hypothetical protein [Alphaproteobacteria bacterium]